MANINTATATRMIVSHIKGLPTSSRRKALKILGDGGHRACNWVLNLAIFNSRTGVDKDVLVNAIMQAREDPSFKVDFNFIYPEKIQLAL